MLYFCTFSCSPPKKKAVPNTSNMFDKIDPSNDSCTNRYKPLDKAAIETISSVAFPKVALSSPPIVSFVCRASCSVTKPNLSANGQRAIREKTKVVTSDQPRP